MVGLVALAVLTDEAGEIIGFNAFPGDREELIQFPLKILLALVKTDQPLDIVRGVK